MTETLNSSDEKIKEAFSDHPCNPARYHDMIEKVNEIHDHKNCVYLHKINQSLTKEDKDKIKEMQARYKKMRPLISLYLQHK